MYLSDHEIDVRCNRLLVSTLQRWRVVKVLRDVNAFDFRMWCFGSSVHGTCMPWSDLDLCIETHVFDEKEFQAYRKAIIKSYYNPELNNNLLDILYYNELLDDNFKRVAIHENGVLLKDFKEMYV